MPDALVHIGTHKTGTTSFQRWANANRDTLLAEHGVQVFRGVYMESNLSLPLLCTRHDRNTPASVLYPDARLPECRAALREHVAGQVGTEVPTLLVSAEDLCLLRHVDEVEALVDLLAPREVRVAVCLREPDAYLRAYRSQMERLGQRESPYPSSHTYYGPDTWLTRWDEMLATWRQVLGADRVVDFGYESAMAEHGSSIPAILTALGFVANGVPSWRGYRENVTAVEERRAAGHHARVGRLREVLATSAPARAARRVLGRS